MEKEEKKEEDLGLKVVHKDAVFWERIRDGAKKEIENNEQANELNRELIIVATRRIAEIERRHK